MALPTVMSVLDADISGFADKMGKAKNEMAVTGAAGEGIGARITKGLTVGATVVGGALGAIGAGIMSLAEPAARAQDLLTVAVRNTGKAYQDYAFPIDNAVAKQERYGHGVADTKEALAKLTQATGDTGKALGEMGFITDLAANKHISLSEAATLDAKMLAGNGKIYKEFGINVKDATALAHEAENATKAHIAALATQAADVLKLSELQDRLAAKYQLSASQQITLRGAEDGLAAARKTGDPQKIAAAEQKLADVRAVQAAAMKLSVPDQQALNHANTAVATSNAAVTETGHHAAVATQAQADQAKNLGSAHDQLRHKISGTADEVAKSQPFWVGFQTHIQNMIASIGPGLSSALMVTGPAIAALAQGADTSFGHAIGRFAAHRAGDVVDGIKWAGSLILSSGKFIVSLVADTGRFVAMMALRGVITAANTASSIAAWIAEAAVFVAQQAIRLAAFLGASALIIGGLVAQGVQMVVLKGIQLAGAVATGIMTAAQWALNVALSANPIGLVVIAIAALVAGFIWAYNNIKPVRDIVDMLWGKFKDFIGWIGSVLSPVLDGLGKTFKTVGDFMNNINPFGKHSPSLVENVEAGTRVIAAHYDALGSKIRTSLGGALQMGSVGLGAVSGGGIASAVALPSGGGGNVYVTVQVQGNVLNWDQTAQQLADPLVAALARRGRNLPDQYLRVR